MATKQQQDRKSKPLRVFLGEDSPLIRKRLETMLLACGAEKVGHSGNLGPATRCILDLRPDLVILDIQLADGSGFDVLRVLREQAPGIEVVLFSNFAADPYRQLAERLGARGFFDKSREFARLRDAVAQRAAKRR